VKDARAMHDAYRRVLAADSACTDCYLGLGVYQYGLARASALARFVARLIGLGTGDVATAMRYLRRVAHDGDLAQVEGTWVFAAALVREAARDPGGKPVLEREARAYVERRGARYPGTSVFQCMLPLGEMVEVGLIAVGARRHGEGLPDAAARAAGAAVLYALAAGAVVSALGLVLGDRLFQLMTVPPDVARLGHDYLATWLVGGA